VEYIGVVAFDANRGVIVSEGTIGLSVIPECSCTT